ncbi:MAG TPA: long-chain fatty acid--CoA ligase [Gemmatimonadaceae bacterium]|nr:long-chain fatty acid--CoA ligase [Gemmatimonadaceae bacterium]
MEARGGPRPLPGTLNELFVDAVSRFDKPDAFQVKVNGRFEPISHRAALERVRHTALGLEELGFQRGDRVAILAENGPDWAIVDYGALSVGIIDVPVYPTLPAEQITYILRDSGARAVFVSGDAQAEKIREIRGELPALQHVIAFDEALRGRAELTQRELEARGAAVDTPARAERWRSAALAMHPDDVATIIYTSGTTGAPKGVMLTHDNFYSNVVASARAIPFSGHDVALSFLPLSHVFERMAGHYLMFHTGTSIAYAENVGTVPEDLLLVRPTLVLSVPRLYEKMYARVLENALSGSAVKRRIFYWARGVADRWANERLAGREPGALLAAQYRLAQRLVFSKLAARTGGNLRYFVSGGAPLAEEINKFFYAAGLVILEGYGLTETSPVIAVNTPEAFRIGTVGRPIAGVEVRTAEDGEILTRGPHVMKGYFNQPAATREAIEDDGWFHTGDIGVLEDGFLRITDRKKDIIVTAGGKNIAPQPIENLVKTNKFVSQAVMIGDRRKFPVMLVVPDFEQVERWAKGEGLRWEGPVQLLAIPRVQAMVEDEVRASLSGLASFETPKKIVLLDQDFTIESGELTPTLKVKRRVIDQRYRALIDAL